MIDRYRNGLLSDAERTAFELRLETETELRRALDQERELFDFLAGEHQREALLPELDRLGVQHFKTESKKAPARTVSLHRRRRWWSVAATILIFLAIGLWWWTRPLTPQQLYAQYATPPTLALTEMGGTETAAALADRYFNAGNYAAALEPLRSLSDDPRARLALGISLVETDALAEGREILRALAEGNSALRESGRFYLAVSFLKTDEEQQARDLLLEPFGSTRLEARRRELLAR